MSYAVHHGNCLDILPQLAAASIQTCVTSPPYWKLRDYEASGQLGQESAIDDYVRNLVDVFRQVRRVLKPDGTLWLNIGDSYCRSDNKRNRVKKGDLAGIPWTTALALREDGWHLRSSIIWQKTNPCPESVHDRPSRSHEYVFLLSASRRYYYNDVAIREPVSESSLQRHTRRPASNPECLSKGIGQGHKLIARVGPSYRTKTPEELQKRGRNKRDVWSTACSCSRGIEHFATFPPALIEPCILAGAPEGGIVLDTFAGSATTGHVALKHRRQFIGIEINANYVELARRRLETAK